MRNVVAVLVVLMVSSVAQADTPPSKTLERAIRLYDKEDYYSASIELKKVLDGETGDDAANLQRAEFFEAKTIYQLGFAAAAFTAFQRIQADDAHTYHDASLKWLLGLARLLPEASGIVDSIAQYQPGSDAVTQLAELHDEYAVLEGRYRVHSGDFEAALDILHTVPQGSPFWPAAQRAIGEVRFRLMDANGGVAAMAEAATDPAFATLAVRELVFWTRISGDAAAAAAALDAIAAGDGPAVPYATYAASRLAHELPALRGLTDTFDGLALVAICGQQPVDNLAAAIKPLAQAAAEDLPRLAEPDDNAELFALVAAHLADDFHDPTMHVIRIALGRADPLAWATELKDEQALYDKADAAWRTTSVAVDIQTELALQAALAEASAGQWLRDRFLLIAVELGRVDGAGGVVSAGMSGDGLVVPPALCQEAGLPTTEPSFESREPLPLPPPPKAHGCAGCASGDPASGTLALLLLTVASSRARRRRPR